MKKRKIKLFASVASLAMVAAVMGVGVWAATSQSVTVNSTINFSASYVLGTVTLQADKVNGTALDTALIGSTDIVEEAATLINIEEMTDANGAQAAQTVDIELADKNNNGYFDQADGTIKYVFNVKNTGTEKLFYNVTFAAGTTTTIGSGETEGTWTAAVDTATNKGGEGLDQNEDVDVTVTFTYTGANQATIDKATAKLPAVTIEIANAATANSWS